MCHLQYVEEKLKGKQGCEKRVELTQHLGHTRRDMWMGCTLAMEVVQITGGGGFHIRHRFENLGIY